MIFSYIGGSSSLRRTGADLYQSNSRFRASVDSISDIATHIVGFSPAAAMRGDWTPASPEQQIQETVVRTGAMALGLTDMWRDAGVLPGAAIGLSLGEVGAAYCAGVLSRADAATVFCAIAMALPYEPEPTVMFSIEADINTARQFCRAAPVALDFAGEINPGVAAIYASQVDADAGRQFLRARTNILAEPKTLGRYHVSPAQFDIQTLSRIIEDIRPQPAVMPIYSAAVGGLLPADAAFDPLHWVWAAAGNFRYGQAAAAAYADGFDAVVSIGPHPYGEWMAQTARRQSRKIQLISTLTPGEPEAVSWRNARREAKALRLESARPPPAITPATELDFSDPAVARAPWNHHDRLRQAGPVHLLPRQGFWAVVGYEEAKAAFADAETFSSAPLRPVDPVLLAAEPQDHAAMRRLLGKHFSAAAMQRTEAMAARLARDLIRADFDAVQDFGAPLGAAVAAQIMGLGETALADFVRLTEDARAQRISLAELTAALGEAAPAATLYAEILKDGAGAVNETEARSLVRLVWLASAIAIERVTSSCIASLLQHPQVRDAVTQAPDRLPAFIEEVMRLHPPELMIARMTTRDVDLGGVSIPKGALVQICVSAANRDPAQFEDPHSFRLDRTGARHLAFGSGIHQCLGAALSRKVVKAALEVLLTEAPAFRTLQPLYAAPYFATATTLALEQLVIAR
jgi:cytochrome P450